MIEKIIQIRVRGDTADNWASANPVLALFEIALSINDLGEIDTLKVGDGTSAWNDLNVFASAGSGGGSGGDPGADGSDGWSPVLAAVSDGERRMLQVSSWTGGTGTPPASGGYIGVAGLVVDIGDAVDVRGATGATGAQGDPGADGADGADGAPGPSNQIDESSGPTALDVGAIEDGQFLRRSGARVVGDTPSVSPGGSSGQAQFNDAGALAGMSGSSWNDTTRSLTITGATVTASAPLLNMTQTWNDGSVTFDGIRLDVTNTASASSSRLIHILQDGVTAFEISRGITAYAGPFLKITNGVVGNAYAGLRASATGGSGLYAYGSNGGGFAFTNNDGYGAVWAPTPNGGSAILFRDGIRLGSGKSFYWSDNVSGAAGTTDLVLCRDAAGTLAQRNGANAQTFRVYGTYTDASNYRRWSVAWNNTTAILHAEGAGTGTDGSVAFNDAALATNATRGFLMIPSCPGTPTGTPDDIPTGQAPIVYDSTNKKLRVWDGSAWVQTAALT